MWITIGKSIWKSKQVNKLAKTLQLNQLKNYYLESSILLVESKPSSDFILLIFFPCHITMLFYIFSFNIIAKLVLYRSFQNFLPFLRYLSPLYTSTPDCARRQRFSVLCAPNWFSLLCRFQKWYERNIGDFLTEGWEIFDLKYAYTFSQNFIPLRSHVGILHRCRYLANSLPFIVIVSTPK